MSLTLPEDPIRIRTDAARTVPIRRSVILFGANMGRVDDKVTIVTGGASGIGRATAYRFAEEGATVVVADVDAEGGSETVRTIEDAGGEATFVRADVTDSDNVNAMVATAVDRYGGLDVLFNNAGIDGQVTSITSYEEATYDRVVDVNLKGVWLGTKFGVKAMVEDGGGSIINTSSIAGVFGIPGFSAYAAAKGGIRLLTQTVALEYAADNIRVNAVAPGPVRTPMVERAMQEQEAEERFRSMEPMEGIAEPEEVAAAVLFLASDDASRITGSTLPVDGGYLAGRRD